MKEKNRLSKILARAGVASRRASEELIFAGKVSVNGKVTTVPQTMVCLSEDVVLVDGKPVTTEDRKEIFILNKPKGYICTNKRPGKKKIVTDLFQDQNLRLFSVGRLDRETTGLLLVTNDGDFANRVIHPSANLTKEYLVKVSKYITDEHLKILSQGIPFEKKWIRPVSIKKVRKGTVKIAIKEGKKHEVRLMVKNAGLELLELKRIRIGGLTLGDVPLGSYRKLSETEKLALFGTH